MGTSRNVKADLAPPPKGREEMSDRYWDTELQQWVYDDDVYMALNAAQLAICEYYNNEDRSEAARWLLKAHQANRRQAEKRETGK
jgi:hypothetical protein